MDKEFISYEQALALKELGFNEPCMAIYYSKDKSFSWHHHKDHTNNEPTLDSGEFNISVPLYQQAFRWFKEKHDLFYSIVYKEDEPLNNFEGSIWQRGFYLNIWNEIYSTYEEAEQACLDKLIEIITKQD